MTHRRLYLNINFVLLQEASVQRLPVYLYHSNCFGSCLIQYSLSKISFASLTVCSKSLVFIGHAFIMQVCMLLEHFLTHTLYGGRYVLRNRCFRFQIGKCWKYPSQKQSVWRKVISALKNSQTLHLPRVCSLPTVNLG